MLAPPLSRVSLVLQYLKDLAHGPNYILCLLAKSGAVGDQVIINLGRLLIPARSSNLEAIFSKGKSHSQKQISI